MTKLNISNVKRVLNVIVEQREHRQNTMQNPQLSTSRNTLFKIIWLDNLFIQKTNNKIEKTFLKMLKQHDLTHLNLRKI